MPGQYGDVCHGASDCASGLCIGLTGGTTGMCTITCTNESACKLHHGCYDVGGGTKVCVPSDSGQKCPNGTGSNCFAGICLVHPADVTQSECATPCDSVHSCPNGFSCSLTQIGSTVAPVCTRVGTPCTSQGASTECVSRFCITQQTTPTDGVCTGNCATSSDCPSDGGWACGLDDDGMSSVSVCQPIGGTCTDNGTTNDCYSKTCAIASGNTGFCTAFCMNDQLVEEAARCPSNFTCTAEPYMSTTVYVCE